MGVAILLARLFHEGGEALGAHVIEPGPDETMGVVAPELSPDVDVGKEATNSV